VLEATVGHPLEPKPGLDGPFRHGESQTLEKKQIDERHIRDAGLLSFPEAGAGCSKRCINSGAGDGDRTRDIQLGKLAFYR